MILWNLNHDRCLVTKQHTRKRVTFVHALVNITRISRSTRRWHACSNMFFFFLREFVAILSPATQQESSSRPSEDEEIRHTQEKASVSRHVLALLSFLKPLFGVTVDKYTKFLQRIIQAWYFFKSTAIIVSMAKETIGIRPDDAISAYNGGKLNFPWPTEISRLECACSTDDLAPLINLQSRCNANGDLLALSAKYTLMELRNGKSIP